MWSPVPPLCSLVGPLGEENKAVWAERLGWPRPHLLTYKGSQRQGQLLAPQWSGASPRSGTCTCSGGTRKDIFLVTRQSRGLLPHFSLNLFS